MPELSPWQAVAFYVLSFFTSAMTAAAGIGGGVVLLAIMATVYPPAVLIPVHGMVQLGSNGGRALLMTGDRDMFQCATDQVTVLYVSTGKRGSESVGPAEVRKRYGIGPELVPDFIALRGDPSDGLPGAKGVGEKTAAELLQTHGSLDAVLENAIRETKPRLRTSLLESHDELLAFRDIATLRDAGVKRPRDKKLDRAGAAAAARERGMNRLAERLAGG